MDSNLQDTNTYNINKQPTDARAIDMTDFMYPLPDSRIAKHPLKQRDACKLLVADINGIKDEIFSNLPTLLPDDALLVYNNTRVINARVRMHKATGAAIEIFCLDPVAPADYERNFAAREHVTWNCLVGNSKRWKDGALSRVLSIEGRDVTLTATRTQGANSTWDVTFSWDDSSLTFADIISAAGVIPIPPYLNRNTEESDAEDYQTVFSRIDGSVAAPTAGLHFTDEVLRAIDARGIERANVTLHVGAGTFQPVSASTIGGHPMHSELIVVERQLIENLANTKRRVFAVGTTSVRTLESLYHMGVMAKRSEFSGELPQWYWLDNPSDMSVKEALDALISFMDAKHTDRLVASTRICIAPGYRYRIVNGLITNFHQPGSTLLLLVSAMIGDTWRNVYEHALQNDYRFLSYGDACLFIPQR